MARPSSSNAPARAETLAGRIERVVFHAEDTGYCILRVTVDGRREPATVVGKAPRVVAGEHLEATGAWEPTRDFGPQFKATELRLTRPSSEDGIERYLGSGLIDGIGPAYAKRIVARFGKDVFRIIEEESAKLEEVEGIGRKRRLEIRASWMKQRAIHGIMVFLHERGISSARALRIYKTYGDEALEVLRSNPYRLANDIRGIGFRTADEIAGQLGIDKAAPERLRAGILHTLETAADSGHTCLPQFPVLEKSAELLGADLTTIETELEHLIQSAALQRHTLGSETIIQIPALREAEGTIAERIRLLTSIPVTYPEIEFDPAIEWAARHTGKTLAESQVRAVKAALQHRLLVVTGGPGVGKTTIVQTILAILERKDIAIVLAAPTGRAARRLQESTGREAKTLHRLLEFQGDGSWGRGGERHLSGELFVVDEVSMIDTPLMAQFLASVPNDAHVLLVGDADQLPSVGPGRVLSDLLNSDRVPSVRLTEIFRQAASSRIVTSAHDINGGHVPDLKPARDSDFFFLEESDPERIRDTIIDLVRTRLPNKYRFDPVSDIQVLTPMNRQSLGTKALNNVLQSAMNPPNELKFEIERFGVTYRVGDKVIQTSNNYDKEVFNGDIGHLIAIDTDPIRVQVRFEGDRLVTYEPGELDELQLAYALTIHKSQGSEFPCVIIPVSTQHYILLERSLIYTAITRAKKLVILVGDPKALEMAIQRQQSRKRWTGLKHLLD